MKTIYTLTLIFIIITVLISIIMLLYSEAKKRICSLYEKLNNIENKYIEKYNNKYELVTKFINGIEDKYKIENKTFNNVKALEGSLEVNQKNEKLLNKCYKELKEIKEEKQKIKELKLFRKIIDDYEENELALISLRTYYNSHTLIFNSLIKKFPYNIISKFKKFSTKNLIEGKEIDLDFNNDLEV